MLFRSGELVILHAESVEDAFKWCTEDAGSTYMHSKDNSGKDFCFMSTCVNPAEVGSVINQEKQSTENVLVDNTHTKYVVEIELDFANGKACWIFNEGKIREETKLPNPPLHLVYSTGHYSSGAKFLSPIKKE